MKNNTSLKLTKLLFVTLTFILVISSSYLYAFANTDNTSTIKDEDKLNINITTPNLNTITTNTTIPDFIDVPKNFWGYTDIMEMVKLGYLKGVGNGKFNPNGQVTYAEFLTMLANMFYEVEGYPNITNKPWYYDNVRWLGERGITNAHITHINDNYDVGYFGGFSYHGKHYLENVMQVVLKYNIPIKRKNMALYMYNIAFNSIGQIRSLPKPDVLIYDKEGLTGNVLKQYDKDVFYQGKNPLYLQHIIDYNYKQGFLKGVNTSGEFGAERYMTRAEAAAVLKRMYYASTERVQPTAFKDILVENHYIQPNKKPDMRTTNPERQQNYHYADYDIMAVYRPGKLTNGKPNTPENKTALLKEIMEAMPTGKEWADSYTFPGFENAIFNDTIGVGNGGCNGYASFIATALYGHYAPMKYHNNIDNAIIGDIYDIRDDVKNIHYAVIIGKGKEGFYEATSGNSGGLIYWDWSEPGVGSSGYFLSLYPKSYVYTLDETIY